MNTILMIITFILCFYLLYDEYKKDIKYEKELLLFISVSSIISLLVWPFTLLICIGILLIKYEHLRKN